jgi:hypothetical protein
MDMMPGRAGDPDGPTKGVVADVGGAGCSIEGVGAAVVGMGVLVLAELGMGFVVGLSFID